MFENAEYSPPGKSKRLLKYFDKIELLRAYRHIINDPDGAGIYETVAVAIRTVWEQRGYHIDVLNYEELKAEIKKEKATIKW